MVRPLAMMGGLDESQLRSRNVHYEAGHAVIGAAVGLRVTAAILHATPTAVSSAGYDETGRVTVGPFAPIGVRQLLAFHAAGVRAAHR